MRSKSLLLLLFMALLSVFPSLVFAADPAAAVGVTLGVLAEQVVMPVLGSVLLGVLTILTNKLKIKTGIEIDNRVIEEAVHYAEAAGNAYLLDHGRKMPPVVSRQIAIEYINDSGSRRLKKEQSDSLRRKIDAVVQRVFNRDRDYTLAAGRSTEYGLRGAMNGRPSLNTPMNSQPKPPISSPAPGV